MVLSVITRSKFKTNVGKIVTHCIVSNSLDNSLNSNFSWANFEAWTENSRRQEVNNKKHSFMTVTKAQLKGNFQQEQRGMDCSLESRFCQRDQKFSSPGLTYFDKIFFSSSCAHAVFKSDGGLMQ